MDRFVWWSGCRGNSIPMKRERMKDRNGRLKGSQAVRSEQGTRLGRPESVLVLSPMQLSFCRVRKGGALRRSELRLLAMLNTKGSNLPLCQTWTHNRTSKKSHRTDPSLMQSRTLVFFAVTNKMYNNPGTRTGLTRRSGISWIWCLPA
jgi:hypothetical protein